MIPDFVLIFDYQGREETALVEVKTKAVDFSRGVGRNYLGFGRSQYMRLSRYAETVRLPVLVAWKAEPLGWLLIDLSQFHLVESAYRITLAKALKENLLGLILGDFSVSFQQGASFVMRLRRLSKGKNRFNAEIVDLYFENARGERVKKIEGPFLDLFEFGADEVEYSDKDGFVTQRLAKVGNDVLPAHRLLPLAFKGWDATTHTWRQALGTDFAYRLANVRNAASDGLAKGLVRYILDVAPQTMPSFLSDP